MAVKTGKVLDRRDVGCLCGSACVLTSMASQLHAAPGFDPPVENPSKLGPVRTTKIHKPARMRNVCANLEVGHNFHKNTFSLLHHSPIVSVNPSGRHCGKE